MINGKKLFTVGSAVWVVNGFLVFLPSLNVISLNIAAGGWTAFVGGSLFEVGSYLMVLEALNRKHEVLFTLYNWSVNGSFVLATQFIKHSQNVCMTFIIILHFIQRKMDRRKLNNNGNGLEHSGMKLGL